MRIFLIFSMLVILLSCHDSNSTNKQFKKWVTQNSEKIESLELTENHNDLVLLKQIVGEADIVCLGESRHDIHEQFELKLQFIKYLVEELNFRTIALEASLPYSNRINDYIQYGNGDIDQLMADMPGWFIWDTKEIKKLFEWLKYYNQKNEDKIRFYGIDIVAPNDALHQILNYLQKVDSSYFEKIKDNNFGQKSIVDNYWPTTQQNYSRLSTEEKQELKNNYNKLYGHIQSNKSNYISNFSQSEYEWIRQIAFSAREANEMFSAEDRIQMGLIRDQAMASISRWVASQKHKMIIWAHNVHIVKSEFTMSMFPDTKIQGMGNILSQEFGTRMISIGASFNKGHFVNENRRFTPAESNTIDGMLASLDIENFLLDMQIASENKIVSDWLEEVQSIRGQEFEMNCVPSNAFDAFFFTNSISKVKYNAVTEERLRDQ